MEYHTLNICVKTATDTDYYAEVAINKFPMVVIGDEEELRELLAGDQMKDWLGLHIRNQEVYRSAKFCIRHFQEDGEMVSEELAVSDLVKLEF